MQSSRPSWLDARNLFPTGFVVVITLYGLDAALPKSHLWAQPWFMWCFWLSLLLIVVGLYGFVAHYRERTIPLVLIGGAVGAVVLRAPVVVLVVLGLATFLTTLYFLSESRTPRQREGTMSDAKDDPFRVKINHLTVDRRGSNPVVLADVSVTNLDVDSSLDRWQMLYWHNGIEKEAGKQDLQDAGWRIEEMRQNWQPVIWGFDEQLDRVTAKTIYKDETRQGFFYAVLCDSANISSADLRTVRFQYRALNRTFNSDRAGAAVFLGKVSPRND